MKTATKTEQQQSPNIKIREGAKDTENNNAFSLHQGCFCILATTVDRGQKETFLFQAPQEEPTPTCMPDKPGIIMEQRTRAIAPLAVFSFRNCLASNDDVKHIGKNDNS